MQLMKHHVSSHTILEKIQILEQRVDAKLTENRALRRQLAQQEQHCVLQAERIIEMNTKIKSLKGLPTIDANEVIKFEINPTLTALQKPESVDVEEVINLEWHEIETPSCRIVEM